MPLRNLSFQEDYRTGEHRVLEQLFRPALAEAVKYWRAVGYFSSSALEAFGKPLGESIRKGGAIRLITSVELMPNDIEAINNGHSRSEVCSRRIEQIIEEQISG